jgi:hypothetical protein
MKTAKEIAQWVIDNRYPKSENEKVSDAEMYHELVESIEKLCNIPPVMPTLQQDDNDRLFHECPNCNCRCNCTDQPCSCCNEA